MRLRFLGLLAFGAALLPTGAACTSVAADTTATDEAVTEGSCIIENPIESDGYTQFETVDAAKVTRRIMTASGPAPDPMKVATPTEAQLRTVMGKVNAYVAKIRAVRGDVRRHEVYSPSNRGQAMEPYCLFHKANAAVYGTVVLFHGYNDRPHQQAKLASYLFHTGFNVYNVFLANQYMVEGKDYWPRTTYRPDVLATLQAKLANPANQATLAPIIAQIQSGEVTPSTGAALSPEQVAAIDQVLSPELSYSALQRAWQAPGGEDYKRFFNWHEPVSGESTESAAQASDFYEYVRDAKARLDDLAQMPGPLFVGGLSVGGALAIAVAGSDDTHRVHGMMAHAPWLRSVDAKTTTQISVVGPLDQNIGAAGGEYPIRWANHGIAMSPANIAANLALGAWASQASNVQRLALVPTAMITTGAEDSADNTATYNGVDDQGHAKGLLQQALTSNAAVASLHVAAQYPKELRVGHAMTDPENYADGNGVWNRNWRSLYQESYRFYLTGAVSEGNLRSSQPDGSLPAVPCKTPDYPERCP